MKCICSISSVARNSFRYLCRFSKNLPSFSEKQTLTTHIQKISFNSLFKLYFEHERLSHICRRCHIIERARFYSFSWILIFWVFFSCKYSMVSFPVFLLFFFFEIVLFPSSSSLFLFLLSPKVSVVILLISKALTLFFSDFEEALSPAEFNVSINNYKRSKETWNLPRQKDFWPVSHIAESTNSLPLPTHNYEWPQEWI